MGFYDFGVYGDTVVGPSTGSYFWVSNDNGKCFTPIPWNNNTRFLQMVSEDVIYAFSYYGTMYKTMDGGNNWTSSGNIGNTFSRGMLFVNERNGIAGADNLVKMTPSTGAEHGLQ